MAKRSTHTSSRSKTTSSRAHAHGTSTRERNELGQFVSTRESKAHRAHGSTAQASKGRTSSKKGTPKKSEDSSWW